MARCALCSKQFTSISRGDQTLRRWSSVEEMANLAQSGCDLCSLFFQYGTRLEKRSQTLLKDILLKLNSIRMPMVSSDTRLWLAAGIREMEGQVMTDTIAISLQPLQLAVNVRTDGQGTLNQAKTLLDKCLQFHPRCRPTHTENHSATSADLPRRLLDLSHGSTIVVIDVEDQIRAGAAAYATLSRYVTLSYRWGVPFHDIMLGASFSGSISFELDCMPQTFKDAIFATRALGINYLWIDALCIVQPSICGNDEDWSTEGPRMGSIYYNAVCTIAATCSESVEDGFLSRTGSDLVVVQPCEVSFSTTGGPQVAYLTCVPCIKYTIKRAGLNKRGWVQQERVFSRRLFHFTTEGLFLECDESLTHSHYGDIKSENLLCPDLRKQRDVRAKTWYSFVEMFSESEFTNSEDRLVALSSLAAWLQPLLSHSKYYAGLWSRDIIRGLSWYCHEQKSLGNTRLSIAPSWSWASLPRSVRFSVLWDSPSVNLVEVLDIQVSLGQSENEYGNVRGGKLSLLGQICSRKLPTRFTRDFHGAELGTFWDELQDESQAERIYSILPLFAVPESGFPSKVVYRAIVIETATKFPNGDFTNQEEKTYRRIGWVSYEQTDIWKSWKMKRRKHWWKIGPKLSTVILV